MLTMGLTLTWQCKSSMNGQLQGGVTIAKSTDEFPLALFPWDGL